MFDNNFANGGNNFGAGVWGGIPQGTGYQYNPQPQQVPRQMNNLTQKEIQRLVQKENQFSLQITETEKLRAACNHRRDDGMGDTLVENPNTGECTCQICGYTFRPAETTLTEDDIRDSCLNVLDLLQTIKLLYINMPAEAAREYYQIIPLIEKIPKLFGYAVKDYAKYESYNPYNYNGRNSSTMTLFNMLSGALGGGMPGMAQQGQPFMGQPMPGPGVAPYGMPQQNMQSNPFVMGGGAPGYVPQTAGYQYTSGQAQPGAPGYAPQTAGYQYTPGQAQPGVPVSGQAPENVQATTDGQNVDVKAEFKA